MSEPLFTIGIPTFNRVNYLKESLGAALSQSYMNIQVVVCDNASSDTTSDYVQGLNDPRIKYIRNDENIGILRNFSRVLECADGEYFSWLQDDDLIVNDFAERAVQCMKRHDAGLYLGTALCSAAAHNLNGAQIYGPPVTMNWFQGKEVKVEAETILGLSYLISVAIPPVVAFKRDTLKSNCASLSDASFPLFVERSLLFDVAVHTQCVADPRICGLWREHPGQSHQAWWRETGRSTREWKLFTEYLGKACGSTNLFNQSQLRECFEQVPESTLRNWINLSSKLFTSDKKAGEVGALLNDVAKMRGIKNQKALETFKYILPPVAISICQKIRGKFRKRK